METMKVCRGRLLEYMLNEYGLHAWTEYWNTLHNFIIGENTKEELDEIIFKYLSANDKVSMHNDLILAILELGDEYEVNSSSNSGLLSSPR